MLPADVTARIGILRANLRPETQVGFHGHHNLGMGIANSLAAIEAGALRIDASCAGLGAGAGNTPLEVFAAVCERAGIATGVDVLALADVAETVVRPIVPVGQGKLDRAALLLGYAGVYSSFLLHAERAAERFGVSSKDILVEVGRRKAVGGQEDLIIDIAAELAGAA
jgi:4-hydroxy-2-oxovalerate/4-hydroxy-2-oxohexanoate aldolase